MHWTSRPFPVAPGGLNATHAFRPLRTTPSGSVRQPDLGGAAKVMGLGGFGTGAGATILPHGQDADQSAGLVAIWTGTTNPGATGNLQLQFPAPLTAAYWAAADWATVAVTPSSNILQLTWTANRQLLPRERLFLVYQWATST